MRTVCLLAAVPAAVSAASKPRASNGRLAGKFWGSFEMRKFALVVLLSTSTFVVGCATKNYVRETVPPIQTKVDQAADTNTKQDTEIAQDETNIQKNTTDISATREIATGADTRAGDATNRANAAQAKANQDAQDVSSLKTVVANLDDYKVTNTVTVLFP